MAIFGPPKKGKFLAMPLMVTDGFTTAGVIMDTVSQL